MTTIADPFDDIEMPEAAPAAPKVTYPPSPAQVNFAVSLMQRKLGLTGAELEAGKATVEATERRKVSELIDRLKPLPDKPRVRAQAVTVDGMYRNPGTGDIFKVQRAVHGSGELYAKVLATLDEPVMKRGKEFRAEFQYAPGAIKNIKAEWLMSREEAAEFGHLYGMCCRCGATLTDEQSIERGIGPVCYGKF